MKKTITPAKCKTAGEDTKPITPEKLQEAVFLLTKRLNCLEGEWQDLLEAIADRDRALEEDTQGSGADET